MSVNLLDIIGRQHIWAVLSDIAAQLKQNPSNIVDIRFWATGVWVKRRHNLATIVSYRQLECWIPLLKQAILKMSEFSEIAQLQELLEVEFEKRPAAYPQQVREELRQLLAQRQAQLEAENLWKAEILTRGNAAMINSCKTLAELLWVKRAMREQYLHLKPYPHLIDNLRQLWEQQAQNLRNAMAA